MEELLQCKTSETQDLMWKMKGMNSILHRRTEV